LADYVGGKGISGKKLKSTTGWDRNGNGTDEYGFSALPGGADNNGSYSAGNTGFWWSATDYFAD